MEKQAVTIYTVAREARVSMATVSRVVNGNPNVKPATRQKVLDVIERLNYRPNAVARGLASKRTTTVGVVIPSITNPYFAELALGIDDIASMYKYNIILANSDYDNDKILKVVRNLHAKQVDGIVFMGFDLSPELRAEFKSSSTPVVVAGSVVNDKELPAVRIDYRKAAKEAVTRLLDHNHDHVALVTSSLGYSINADDRLSGYKDALADAGVDFDDQLVIETDGSYKQIYDQAKAIADSGVTDSGIKVPDDFEIISSNDTTYTRLCRPMLTSISQPLYDIGAVSMRLLTKLMEDKDDSESDVILEHSIIPRQSTRLQ